MHTAGTTFGAKSWRWLEGSEGRTAIDVKDANKRETCDDTKYSVLARSGKSVIEEWRNPPKYSEDLLRNDQMYEERAVDVVIDNRPPDLLKRHPRCAPLPKIANDGTSNKNNNDDKLIKIKRPQGGGTVRSIPIKDYRASIAHNIGTLRRSVAPQSQFESLVSEPEKSVYVPSRKRVPITRSSHHRSVSQTTCVAAQTARADNAQRRSCCFCDSQHDGRRGFRCANVDLSEHVEEARRHGKTEDRRSQDGSDIDEYFRRSSRGRFGSNDRRVTRCARGSSGNTGAATATKNEKAKAEEEAEALQLAEGHVGQKISAYEQNARRSSNRSRGSSPKYRSLFEVKGHRTIGVPLVGMHNACGLPVVASWHDHDLLDSLRISRRIAATAGPIYKSPRTIPYVRRRSQPKRKAPQPDHREMVHPRNADRGIKRSTIKSAGCMDAINDSGRSRRKHRRSSFTMTKVGSLSSKNSFKRIPRRYGIKASSLVDTFGRKSIKEGSGKRTTLYAKDDGEEPVQVLKSLCLNPLARANPETDMMWWNS